MDLSNHRSFLLTSFFSKLLEKAPKICPKCKSDLIAQHDAANHDRQTIEVTCRPCGENSDPESVIIPSIAEYFFEHDFAAAKDGGTHATHHCPDLGRRT